jgi:hypothetical protein
MGRVQRGQWSLALEILTVISVPATASSILISFFTSPPAPPGTSTLSFLLPLDGVCSIVDGKQRGTPLRRSGPHPSVFCF